MLGTHSTAAASAVGSWATLDGGETALPPLSCCLSLYASVTRSLALPPPPPSPVSSPSLALFSSLSTLLLTFSRLFPF